MPVSKAIAIAPLTIARAWNVQGRPGAALHAAVRSVLEVELPAAANTSTRADAGCALWLGPTSWLVIASDSARRPELAAAGRAFEAAGGALFDLSAARVGWRLCGPGARTVLAQGCPLDLHPRAFAAGACAQSVFGHINALIVRDADDGGPDAAAFVLMVARSYARDVEYVLREAAAPLGLETRPPLAWP